MKLFIISGIVNGAVYGLLAIGLVLVYKGARVFNFAQGEFGSVAAYVAWALFQQKGLPYGVAILIALAVAAGMGFTMERLVVRPLFNASRVTLLVATAGVTLAAIQLQLIFGKPKVQSIDPWIRGRGVSILGLVVEPQKLIIVAILAVLAVALWYFFTRTDTGLAVLATSQEPVATELVGISTKRVSSLVWTLAGLLGGIAGLALVPTNVFFPGFMTVNTLLAAFTAAVLGGITSLPGAFVGGLVIGLTHSMGDYLGTHYLANVVPGLSNVLVLGLLIAVLVLRPRGLLGTEA